MIISPDKYSNFVTVIKAMIPLVKDLQIFEGHICQKDSDTNWLIIGDLTPIFGEKPDLQTINLYSIDNKSPFLKMFTDLKNDVEITFLENEQRYKFSDGVSSYTSRKPDDRILRKYDVGDIDKMEYNPNKLVTGFELDKKMIKRATAVMQVYSTDIVNLEYDEETSTSKLNFGGKMSTNGSFDLLSKLPCNVPFEATSVKMNVLKTSVGDSASVNLYMASDRVQNLVDSPIAILTIKTVIGGCPFEYRQKRRVEM